MLGDSDDRRNVRIPSASQRHINVSLWWRTRLPAELHDEVTLTSRWILHLQRQRLGHR